MGQASWPKSSHKGIGVYTPTTAECGLLSFLYCYSGYHQITLKEDDQIKTSFITPFNAYCYMTMSFGLKNAGATYQRAIQQCLHDDIRDDLIEAYVDDVVVKTRDASTLIDNLDQTFKALNKYKWKLNPKKCIFGSPPVYYSATSSAATAYDRIPQK